MRLPHVLGYLRYLICVGFLVSAPALRAQSTAIPPLTVFAVHTQDVTDSGDQVRRVTLALDNVSLQDALNTIARQTGLALVFNDQDPKLKAVFTRRITVRLMNRPVAEALATVLEETGYTAAIPGAHRLIVIEATQRSSNRGGVVATGVIAGRITDSASGAGLSGASVRVEGIKLSTITSDSGRFTLRDVPAGEQLLSVRLFGYKPVDRTVTVVDSQRTTVRIAMVAVPTVLSGVVTTATGLQRKIAVGNDITTLNVDSIMQVAPVTSVTDLLETRVPGLTVVHSSGTPGDPSRIRLRGTSSLQLNNDPIVIVNGIRVYASQSDPRNDNLAPSVGGQVGATTVKTNAFAAPSPLDQIDPSTIETIEVLKGPSASALYGSDAANGVIVITTKRGRTGPTQWSLNLGQGINWVPGDWPTNYYKFGEDQELNQFGLLCVWSDPHCTVDSVVAFQALNDPQYTPFTHGGDQTAALTISGGVPTLTYSVTGSASSDAGNLKLPGVLQQQYDSAYGAIPRYLVHPDHYRTWGVGGILTAQPSSKATVSLSSQLFESSQQRSSLQDAISTLSGLYIEPGGYISGTAPSGWYLTPSDNYVDSWVERVTDEQLTSTNALTLNWQPLSWLPMNATVGLNTMERTDNTYVPSGVNITGPLGLLTDTTGYYGIGHGTSRDQTISVGTVLPLPKLPLAIGGNLYSTSTNDFTAYTDYLSPGVSTPSTLSYCPTPLQLTNCQFISTTTQSSQNASTYGWYLEPRLNVGSRLFITPGFRLDGGSGGSSSAGSVGGLSGFPKINVSWVALDRGNSRPWGGVLTLLRPRFAFGYAGTQPQPVDKLRLFNVGVLDSVPGLIPAGEGGLVNVYSTGDFHCGSANFGTYAVCLSTLGNTQLRPERSTELEGGLDATLWGGRLSLTYTQYDKTRKDAILSIPVAPSVSGSNGAQFNIEKNIGVIRNTGTEVTANAILVQSRALSWNIGANISNDNNIVVKLNPGQTPICLGVYSLGATAAAAAGHCQGTRIAAGYPLAGIWATPIIGYSDANHDGVLEANEVVYGDTSVYVGQSSPKYQLNFTTDLSILNGRLSVHATFAYQNGLTQDNSGACNSGSFHLLPNAPSSTLATQAAAQAAGCVGAFVNPTTLYGLIQTVNTLRFSDLSINYTVPRQISSWFRVPRMTVALQGSNLGLHTNYRGLDPDVNAFSTVSAADETADTGQLPEPRTWWLRMTLGN